MRHIIIVLSIVFLSCATATVEERQKQYIIDTGDMSKKEIFTKTIDWMATAFKSSKSVIELKDEDRGKIIGNIAKGCYTGTLRTKLTIEIKDKKVRFTFFAVSMLFNNGFEREVFSSEINCIDYDNLIDSYIDFVKQKDKDW